MSEKLTEKERMILKESLGWPNYRRNYFTVSCGDKWYEICESLKERGFMSGGDIDIKWLPFLYHVTPKGKMALEGDLDTIKDRIAILKAQIDGSLDTALTVVKDTIPNGLEIVIRADAEHEQVELKRNGETIDIITYAEYSFNWARAVYALLDVAKSIDEEE